MQLINAVDLLAKSFPPPPFLVQGFLPEGLILFAAPPKSGKSWFCLDLGTAVAKGTDFMGLPTTQGDVLYLTLEDHEGRIHHRLTAQLDGTSQPDRLTIATEASDLDHGLIEELEDEWIAKVDDPRLIIVDTWAHTKGGANETPDYERTVNRVRLLRAVVRRHSLTVVVVHHTKKGDAMGRGGDPFDDILGSQGLLGTVDTAMVLRGQRFEGSATIHLTGRDVEDMSSDAQLDKNSMRWAFTETSATSKLGLDHQKAKAFEVILDGGSSNADVRAALKVSPQQASRLLGQLKDKKLIESDGFNNYSVTSSVRAKLGLADEEIERDEAGGCSESGESRESCPSSHLGDGANDAEQPAAPDRAAA